jgi:hypothetical protein
MEERANDGCGIAGRGCVHGTGGSDWLGASGKPHPATTQVAMHARPKQARPVAAENDLIMLKLAGIK